ncbi:MAG TPA: hypothetical protein EYN66_00885 [Myxococcales bacterium]|nr:hypothetical protein [Myxococcales bacterium]
MIFSSRIVISTAFLFWMAGCAIEPNPSPLETGSDYSESSTGDEPAVPSPDFETGSGTDQSSGGGDDGDGGSDPKENDADVVSPPPDSSSSQDSSNSTDIAEDSDSSGSTD